MTKISDRKNRVATSSGAALAAVMLGSPGLAAPAPAPAPVPVEQAGQVRASENSGRRATDEKHPSEAISLNFTKIAMEYKHKDEYAVHKGGYAVAGVGDGHTVFEDARGNLFYVDEATGDQKFVSRSIYLKYDNRSGNSTHPIKLSGKVRILGIDEGGKLIMSNPRGEKFHLDAATGDMIFVK